MVLGLGITVKLWWGLGYNAFTFRPLTDVSKWLTREEQPCNYASVQKETLAFALHATSI